MAALSVVIPAHNEADRIARCLDHLLADAHAAEFEVVVVCNGCTDDTADRARRAAPDAIVTELSDASKIAALDRGDELVSAFPRLYLDADVVLDTAAVRTLAAALAPDVLAVAPGLEVDTAGCTWPVRSYTRIWSALPSVRDGLAGRGAILLSRAGRSRFGSFPDLIADDLFLDRLFAPSERLVRHDVASTIGASPDLPTLVARKARVHAGNTQFAHEAARLPVRSAKAGGPTAWVGVVRDRPRLVVDVPSFVVVSLLARWRARRQQATGAVTWARHTGEVSRHGAP